MDTGALVVIGCGWIARRHAAAARRLRVPLIFASRDLERARHYRRRFGGLAAYGGYAEALADRRATGAIICTPHDRHLSDAGEAFAAGKHVLWKSRWPALSTRPTRSSRRRAPAGAS